MNRVPGFFRKLLFQVTFRLVFNISEYLLFLHSEYMVHLRQGFGVHGRLSEWLGIGLQNRERRFESATDLN